MRLQDFPRIFWMTKVPTIREFSFLAVFAFMPIWLSVLIAFFLENGALAKFNQYLFNGEILILSAATIGPLIHLVIKDYQNNDDGFSRAFPLKSFFVLSISCICLISAALIALTPEQTEFGETQKTYLWYGSLMVAVFSGSVWCLITALKYSIETGAAKMMRLDTTDFLDEWNNE